MAIACIVSDAIFDEKKKLDDLLIKRCVFLHNDNGRMAGLKLCLIKVRFDGSGNETETTFTNTEPVK